MDKISEIEKFLAELNLPSELAKQLYLEQLLENSISQQLATAKCAATIRNYFQVTAYLNLKAFTVSSQLVENCRSYQLVHRGQEKTLLHILSVHSLLQIPELGIPDHELEKLSAVCEDYISNIRPLFLEQLAELCES
jgi:hypothetical protein